MAKYCENCGAPLQEGAIGCVNCGTFFKKEEPAHEFIEQDANFDTIVPEFVPQEEVKAEEPQKATKYCGRCGGVIDADAVVCIHCGRAVATPIEKAKDSDKIGWGFLGFFISMFLSPIVGLVMWLTMKQDTPKMAKNIGIGTLVATIIDAVVVIGFVIWYAVALNAAINGDMAFELVRSAISALPIL